MTLRVEGGEQLIEGKATAGHLVRVWVWVEVSVRAWVGVGVGVGFRVS